MEKENLPESNDKSIEKQGFISQKLSQEGIPNNSLANDHIGVEIVSVQPNDLYNSHSVQTT